MRLENRPLWLVLVAVAMLGWAGCGGGCPTTSLSSSGSGGGGSTGGTSTGGTACVPVTNPGGGSNTSLLYYLDRSNSRILGAGLSTTGAFTALTSFTPPTLPSGVGSDMLIVNQKFLYLPQSDSLSIRAFTIDHTSGALTAVSGSPFATAGADSITSDPAGRFLFVGNQTTGSVSVFQINATTGALVAAPASPFFAFNLDFAKFLAVDGSGTFLYVGQGSPFLPIYAFSIGQNNGALSPVAGSPFALNVALVRTDFTGKHAIGISGTTGDNHLYVFAIDPNTGALTASNVTTSWTISDWTVDTTRRTPGRPPSACSTGCATVSSKSVAARPGLCMRRLKAGSVRSGNRSRRNVAKDTTPAASHTRARAMTQARFGSSHANQPWRREARSSVVMLVASRSRLQP
jgi:hypothetical protein